MTKSSIIVNDSNSFNEEIELRSCTPLLLENISNSIDHAYYLNLLCTAEKDSKIEPFIIIVMYYPENELEVIDLESSPIFEDNLYITAKTTARALCNSLPTYIGDLEFDSYGLKSIEYLYTYISNTETNEIHKVKVTNQIFASMKYLDSWNKSPSEMSRAVLESFDNVQVREVESTVVNAIVDIVDLAIMDKKKNQVAVIIKFQGFVKFDDNESGYEIQDFFLLMTLCLDFKINRRKTRGHTIDSIKDNYLSDIDQYLYLFGFGSKFRNYDKYYMMIEANNKYDKYRLFLIDNALQQKIIDIIYDKYK